MWMVRTPVPEPRAQRVGFARSASDGLRLTEHLLYADAAGPGATLGSRSAARTLSDGAPGLPHSPLLDLRLCSVASSTRSFGAESARLYREESAFRTELTRFGGTHVARK